MSTLWTDIVDPATLTGYARESLQEIERRKGSLTAFLPNRVVPDTDVRLYVGQSGLVDEAAFRAYDAEPEVIPGPVGQRKTIELPAIGSVIPVSEYNQLRMRSPETENEVIEQMVLRTADIAVNAISDTVEYHRGQVLSTGKATINQTNFKSEDDFGRDAELSPTAPKLWSESGADPIGDLKLWRDLYEDTNGQAPGVMLVSREIMRAMTNAEQFQVTTAGGGSRPATEADVAAILNANGLPELIIYTRRTKRGPVLPNDHVLMLPAPVAENAWMDTQLGATFWGQTITSQDANWGIAPIDQPGIVLGLYREPKPPMIAQVISDAITLPVLANANLSLSAKVL